MNNLTFMKAVSKLHQEVLGSLPEVNIIIFSYYLREYILFF